MLILLLFFLFFAAALTLSPGYFGLNNASNSSSIPIYFVPICLGTENTLLECTHYQVASCTHFHDTAVRCFETGTIYLLLFRIK